MNPVCDACGERFEPSGTRTPLLLDCMCVFCRGCVAAHEAAQPKAATDGGGEALLDAHLKLGKTNISCHSCGCARTTPLLKLLPSLPHIQAAASIAGRDAAGVMGRPAPPCDVCGELSTKYCESCPNEEPLLLRGLLHTRPPPQEGRTQSDTGAGAPSRCCRWWDAKKKLRAIGAMHCARGPSLQYILRNVRYIDLCDVRCVRPHWPRLQTD